MCFLLFLNVFAFCLSLFEFVFFPKGFFQRKKGRSIVTFLACIESFLSLGKAKKNHTSTFKGMLFGWF